MDRCVDGIWGGILLRIRGKYDVIAGAPSEIYQYRKTVEIMRNAINMAKAIRQRPEKLRTSNMMSPIFREHTANILVELPPAAYRCVCGKATRNQGICILLPSLPGTTIDDAC